MANNYVILIGLLAMAMSVVLLVVTLRRSARLPEYETREEALAKRVADLETALEAAETNHQRQVEELRRDNQRQVEELRRDIQALQRMLTDKQREVIDLNERIRQLEVDGAKPTSERRQRRPLLVVGLGTDGMLEEDLTALRGVPGLHLAVLDAVSRKSLEILIESKRASGAPVRFLHLATHAGHEGVALADGLADGIWLSRHLADVQVLVLAGCEGDWIGNLLSVVPYVITFRNKIENSDARLFTRAFWTEIGRQVAGGEKLDVDWALDEALRRSPPAVSEMIDTHW